MNAIIDVVPQAISLAAFARVRNPTIFSKAVSTVIGVNGEPGLDFVPASLECLNASLQTCCAELEQDFISTWTLLAAVLSTPTFSVDLTGVYTVVQEIEVEVADCCAQLTQDFQETWTMIDQLGSDQNVTLSILATFVGPCDPIFITTQTVITEPGVYCLGVSLNVPGGVPITINSDDVVLNTNGFSLSGSRGISIGNGFTNIHITGGGSIQNTTNEGIYVAPAATVVRIDHLYFNLCGGDAIRFDDQNQGCIVSNVALRQLGGAGVHAIAAKDMLIDSISVEDCVTLGTAVGVFLDSGPNNNVKVSNLFIANCTGDRFFGVHGFNADNCLVQNVVMLGCHSTNGDVQGVLFDLSNNVVFKDIFIDTLQTPVGQSNAIAFFDCANSEAVNCVVKNLNSQISTGFRLLRIQSGSDIRISNCFAKNVRGLFQAVGMNVEQVPEVLIEDCYIEAIDGSAVVSNSPATTVQRVLARELAYDGFFGTVGAPGMVVNECLSYGATLIGFEMNTGSFAVTNCIALQNGTNYSGSITNIYPIGSSTLAGYNISA